MKILIYYTDELVERNFAWKKTKQKELQLNSATNYTILHNFIFIRQAKNLISSGSWSRYPDRWPSKQRRIWSKRKLLRSLGRCTAVRRCSPDSSRSTSRRSLRLSECRLLCRWSREAVCLTRFCVFFLYYDHKQIS